MSCFPILYWSFRFTWSQSSRMCEKKNPPDSNFKWLQPDETLYRPRVYTVIRSHQVRSFKIKSQNMHWNVKRRCRRGRGVLSQGVRNEGKLSQTLRNTSVAVKFLLRDVAPIQVHTQVVSCPRRSSHTLENVSDLLKKKKEETLGFFLSCQLCSQDVWKIKCRPFKSETYFQVWLCACVTAAHHEPQTTRQTERTTSSELQHNTSNTEMCVPSELQRCGDHTPSF